MSNLSQSSPFDSIRHEDEYGEYWLARELMSLLGYTKWQNFEKPIQSATENIELAGDKVDDHITAISNVVKRSQNGGSRQWDYKMSRYGCYMTALSCDGRKVQVASAKKYFATKAREAEVVVPQQSERLRELELQVALAQANAEMMKCERDLFEKRAEIYKFHGQEGLAQVSDREPAVIDRQIIESINIPQGTRYKGQTLPQIVDYVRKRYGLRLKNGGVIAKLLKAAEKDNLIQKMPRKVDQDYIPEEDLPQVYKLLTDGSRQMLIGE
jgi:DNA-damage-inducible protein D